MSRPKRTARARTLDRRAHAANEKLALAKKKLMDLEPGGTEAYPIEVPTAAVIEPRARGVACPRCDEPFHVESHDAHVDPHGRLREARLRCRLCGERRSLWFRISAPS